jgi:hypothetical protein
MQYTGQVSVLKSSLFTYKKIRLEYFLQKYEESNLASLSFLSSPLDSRWPDAW